MDTHSRSFRPPHCPNPDCRFHRDPTGWHWKRAGFYSRQISPQRIQRFRCLHCGRFFSSQTFSTSYWLKLPHLLPLVFSRCLSCSAIRQIARELDVAPSTVQFLLERLGRHCLLFHQLHKPSCLSEPLVIDGFETFEYSQYWPFHFNFGVGAGSHFLYAFTDAELRRKGRMTRRQRQRREELERLFGRPDPKAVEKEMAAMIRLVLPEGGELEVLSDEHRAYPRALRAVEGLRLCGHQVVSSRRARTPGNPLFPVNLTDLLVRHSGGNHKRETIAYSKRRQAAAERLAIFQVWRNYMKSFSEKRRDATPAERLGLWEGKLTVEELLSRRLFPSLVELPERLMKYYRREVETRQVPNGRRHVLGYAY